MTEEQQQEQTTFESKKDESKKPTGRDIKSVELPKEEQEQQK
jgi:hypothetical protein